MLNTQETHSLIDLARRGDLTAVGHLYDRYHERIFRYVRARVHDTAQAEDLTSEVFTRMVAKLDTYQQQSVPFVAWLYRIARNLVIDHYRKRGNVIMSSIESATGLRARDDGPAVKVEQRLTLERVQNALVYLDEVQREVICLRFLSGLSLKETAQTLDKSVSAVKSYQYRGLLTLRNILDSNEG